MDNSAALSNTFVGTFLYMSPERLLGEMYNSSSDIWSVGVMIIQLWTKAYPFENIKSPIDLLSVIEDLKLDSYTVKFPKSMSTIIQSMLAPSPVNRKTSVELLTSSWFQECSVRNIPQAKQVQYVFQKLSNFRIFSILVLFFFTYHKYVYNL